MLIDFYRMFDRHGMAPKGVLHVGANKGQEAATYNSLGIHNVVWVEAIPAVFQELQRNVAAYCGNTCLQACVADVDGKEVEFNIANNEGQSSSLLELGTHREAHPSVRFVGKLKMTTVRLDTLLAQNSIKVGKGWLLNMDLQGAELLALNGLGSLIHRFKYLYLEVNEKELYQGCCLLPELIEILDSLGFQMVEVKMTKAGWGDALWIKRD